MKQGKSYTIYKINSERIRKNKWSLDIDHEQLKKSGEVVGLAESNLIRILRKINNVDEQEFKQGIVELEDKINELKHQVATKDNITEMRKLNNDLRTKLHVIDVVMIKMSKTSDFDRLNNSKGFKINGDKYIRLFGTAGGVKKETIFYANEKVYVELNRRILNDRDPNFKIVPAKDEAYKSLVSSSSISVGHLEPHEVLVVPDCITNFKEDVIRIFDEEGKEYPTVIEVKDYPIENNASDGFGLICPELAQKWGVNSGACIRNSTCKGMVFQFDFHAFANEAVSKHEKTYFVPDVWGKELKDIRKVKLILTASMVKLWKAYDSIEHYLESCKKNGHTFSITKFTPEKLENERDLNYQFVQALEMSDSDIEELVNPTINNIKDVLSNDYRKALIYLKGDTLKARNYEIKNYDYSDALMIEPRLMNDPFVKSKIKSLIGKRINDLKKGDISVRANFATASGDPYALCQSIFNLPVTGILEAGEHYSRYWSDRGVSKVACFRAPMSVANNIRILNLQDSDELRYWYQYMPTVNIFNAFDTTCHAQNGQDYDGDANLTTDNPVLLRVIKELKPIMCEQGKVDPKIPTEDDYIEANKLSFGDDIGKVTNRGTSLYNVLAKFKIGSLEHVEVLKRIMCVQHYQQNAIDKTKGAKWKPFPKEWYKLKANQINEDDSEEVIQQKLFNLRILADKQPYFFIYRYTETANTYRDYVRKHEDNCIFNYGVKLHEMLKKEDRSEVEENFVTNYYKYMPVSLAPSTMNRICWKVESAFGRKKRSNKKDKFDYTMMKSGNSYNQSQFKQLQGLYNEHNKLMQEHMKISKHDNIDEEESIEDSRLFVEGFKRRALDICNNEVVLTDMLLDVCYSKKNSEKSKQLVWDVCGEQIIKNLLKVSGNSINIPVQDETGDVEYNGKRFKIIRYKFKEGLDGSNSE
ncbi:hypothetical protein [Brevibacillus sp. NRS-1366]|uniref:hypothetical protein n=1 Tax=Brevibacillus sp. NRS-1366 TaxID=3233899 RepID=UPI003D19D1F3